MSPTLLQITESAKSFGKRLGWLARPVPYAWRLAVRRRLHAALGTPMLPLPLAASCRAGLAAAPTSCGGINLLGYARGEFGVAECLRAYAGALALSGYPFDVFDFDIGAASRQDDHSLDDHLSDVLRYTTNAFFINADQMPIARSVLGKPAFARRHNIGFWLWELEHFPHDWRGAFDLVDEVWAPTAFVRNAIAAATRKPVTRVPMPVERAAPTGMDRAYFGIPDAVYVFLFTFDFNSFTARKNPAAVIAAFRRAFAADTSGVRLLLKSSNASRFPEQFEALRQCAADDPRIELRDGFLTREEVSGLQNAANCFVSLHRSEGFGLGLAECMYFGKPVIATGYSGNLDFMDADNSLLVDYQMVPLRRGEYPYWRGQRWAEPDVGHAARLMQKVFADRTFAHNVGGNAAASIRRTHSRAACGTALIGHLRDTDAQRSEA